MKKIILWRSLQSCDCKIYGGIYAADVSLWFVFLRGKPPYLLKKNSSTCCLNIHLHGTVFVEERVVKMLEKKLKKWWGVGRWLLLGDWLGIGWWVVSRCLCINSFVCVYILYFILLLLLFFYFVFSVLIHSFYFNLWVLIFFSLVYPYLTTEKKRIFCFLQLHKQIPSSDTTTAALGFLSAADLSLCYVGRKVLRGNFIRFRQHCPHTKDQLGLDC